MDTVNELLKAILLTAELTGTVMSKEAAQAMTKELMNYPPKQVSGALSRCRRELKYKLTLADILSRLDDGRPGAEQAWAMIPLDEGSSCCWTNEMREAFGACAAMIHRGDIVPARMAFKEAYEKLVTKARDDRSPVLWSVSLGHDRGHREAVIADAVERGLISTNRAIGMMPESEKIQALVAPSRALV